MRGTAALALAFAAVALSACDPGAYIRKNNTELLEAGFMQHEPLPAPRATFCYSTLAEADCYRAPEAGEGERLIESYPPRETLPDEAIK